SMGFDFSAGRNGNIFDFLMLTEGLSFPEAVERLAEQAGLPLPKPSREDTARDERRKTLNEIVELAAKFFEDALASRAGARARGYLADRGIDPATQLKFRLGYAANERFALKEHMGKLGVATDAMIEAGLLVAGEDIPLPYDRFRERRDAMPSMRSLAARGRSRTCCGCARRKREASTRPSGALHSRRGSRT